MNALLILAVVGLPPQAPPIPAGYIVVRSYEQTVPAVSAQVTRSYATAATVNEARLRDAEAGVNVCPCSDCEEARRTAAAKMRRVRTAPQICGPGCYCGCWETGVCTCGKAVPVSKRKSYQATIQAPVPQAAPVPRMTAPNYYAPPPAYRYMPYAGDC